MTKFQQAVAFFRDAHESIGHIRKYSGGSYFDEHLAPVGDRAILLGLPQNAVIAAYGHDYLEDAVNHTDLPKEFGIDKFLEIIPVESVKLIDELTDKYTKEAFPALNRRQRKHLEALRLHGISDLGKIVKMIDLENNTSDILKNDRNFAKTYFKEKKFILSGFQLTSRSVVLTSAFKELMESLQDTLNEAA